MMNFAYKPPKELLCWSVRKQPQPRNRTGDAAQVQMLEDAFNIIKAGKPVLGQTQSRENIQGLFKDLQALLLQRWIVRLLNYRARLYKGTSQMPTQLQKTLSKYAKKQLQKNSASAYAILKQ